MGFYFEMRKTAGSGPALEFVESRAPGVFWALYGFLGFSLACMGLAAHTLLGDLLRSGDWFDSALVWLLYGCVPFYFGAGLWLGFARKFIRAENATLRVGRRFGQRILWEKQLKRNEIEAISIVNRKPAENYAPIHHDDAQYYIKGHWSVLAWKKQGGAIPLDKHTEREMLLPMETDLRGWLLS